MTNIHSIPTGAIDCHYIEQDELKGGLRSNRIFCEFYEPGNYFMIKSRPDPLTVEGWLGRKDCMTPFFERKLNNYSFFKDYEENKIVCFTFDRTKIYRLVSIIPEKPLYFILQQIDNFYKLYSMISQEEIYQHLQKNDWPSIINILYRNKEAISGDTLLEESARMFEVEFLRKAPYLPESTVTESLEKLYMLHHGRFFTLLPGNLNVLTLELAKRKQGVEGYNYALLNPDDESAKAIIQQFELSMPNRNVGPVDIQLSESAWTEIFNRLFELVNNKENSETYFSGPRFIRVIQEFDQYFPDYIQYIELRNKEGKSASRKIFYYDILMNLKEPLRIQVMVRILGQLKNAESHKVAAIEMLMGRKPAIDKIIGSTKTEEDKLTAPVVFISYSWDDEEHKSWVVKLAELLLKNGVEIILDQYELGLGKHLIHFMEQSIKRADRTIIIFTPNYKLKADKRQGGVGYEYSIVNAALFQQQTKNDKIIPVLRAGSLAESIPEFMQQYIHLDLRDDTSFDNRFAELLRDIFNNPIIKKPALGSRPSFE